MAKKKKYKPPKNIKIYDDHLPKGTKGLKVGRVYGVRFKNKKMKEPNRIGYFEYTGKEKFGKWKIRGNEPDKKK